MQEGTWESWLSICLTLINSVWFQRPLATFQRDYNGSGCHIQKEKGEKIRRAHPLIGGFMSLTESKREGRGPSFFNSSQRASWHSLPPQAASCSTLILARNKPHRVLCFLPCRGHPVLGTQPGREGGPLPLYQLCIILVWEEAQGFSNFSQIELFLIKW